jgi:AbiV family abortive infection protein
MSTQEVAEDVSAEFARKWWKALMANACALIEDAAVLAEHSSPGRAQTLLVLAMEELAKARWLYQAAEYQWSRPLGLYGQAPAASGPIMVPEQLRTNGQPHLQKLQAAEQYASGLGGFWHADRRHEYYFPADLDTFESAARRRNLDKQSGLYVDRRGEEVLSPLAIPAGGIGDFIVLAAQAVEMQLIEDHTRQQDAPEGAPIDSSQDLHWVVLPFAHPEEYTSFIRKQGASDPRQ